MAPQGEEPQYGCFGIVAAIATALGCLSFFVFPPFAFALFFVALSAAGWEVFVRLVRGPVGGKKKLRRAVHEDEPGPAALSRSPNEDERPKPTRPPPASAPGRYESSQVIGRRASFNRPRTPDCPRPDNRRSAPYVATRSAGDPDSTTSNRSLELAGRQIRNPNL